jgi:DNA polymerase III delta prime subunit
MSRFHAFSPEDFEELVADLLSEEASDRYEIFARGRDRGIDLRRGPTDGQLEIVQVKHYERSPFSALKTAAANEKGRLDQLDEKPDLYRFVTSQELTVGRKDELVAELRPYLSDSSQILGLADLELLLRRHPQVERMHPKLWLTGSTQLIDMVHAHVRDRSAALLADLEQAMPTYVRHSRFAEAQERLHQGRVLIVAGDPGVGKTTLAHMLIADALAEGYDEPIAVSRHTDEIRRVLDTTRKQVILYDDFLGRIALDRLDKNQDRELTGLMRQVLRAPHTLFILTTREYILRHAIQLHEDLRHGGVEEHRLLLHLRHYSLLDRARIFLNHAYQSTSLPTDAARTLLEDASYLRILEHRNYNPRTIAYITGMAGPALKLPEPKAYLGLALSVLDDPSGMWGQTFRQELGADERALLLAVISARSEVTEADLRALYDAVAPRVGAEAGQEAFQDSLRSLDDSMLRTYHDVGRVFAAGRDPSVDDYLQAHVAGHPEHALALLESARAFEQVQWLVREANVDRLPEVADPLAAAVMRTYEVAPIRWREILWNDDPEPTTTRENRNLPRRLLAIHGFMQRLPALEPHLRMWWQQRLGALLTGLGAEQHNQRSELLALVKTARGAIAASDGASKALAEFMADALYFNQRWSALIELHDLCPQLFSSQRWEQLRVECEAWALNSLTEVEDLRDVEEVDEIVRVANRMGLQVDDQLVEDARDQVLELRGSRDDHPDYEPPDGLDGPVEASDEVRAQIHESFVRLVEDGHDPVRAS